MTQNTNVQSSNHYCGIKNKLQYKFSCIGTYSKHQTRHIRQIKRSYNRSKLRLFKVYNATCLFANIHEQIRYVTTSGKADYEEVRGRISCVDICF